MTRPQLTPEEKRIAELETSLAQAIVRIAAQARKIEMMKAQMAFIVTYQAELPRIGTEPLV